MSRTRPSVSGSRPVSTPAWCSPAAPATFINDLDAKQEEVISFVGTESGRMSERVAKIILLKGAVEKTYADLQILNSGTTVFA